MEGTVERLVLGPRDVDPYLALLNRTSTAQYEPHPLLDAYRLCAEHLETLAPDEEQYRDLMAVVTQLEDRVQVLVAVATDIREAFVIFETLNDRGADLTTADLLKNYLFSNAGQHAMPVEHKWIELERSFEKPDELVRLIRFELASRVGPVRSRKLYRAVQESVEKSGDSANDYLRRLLKAKNVYLAMREPDSDFWNDVKVDVRDALLAYRRFQFESSIPVVLAAFEHWDKNDASALLNKLLKWTIRGLFVGNIGARLSEDVFGEAARAISDHEARNQTAVRAKLARLVPEDPEFMLAFSQYGAVPNSRAKYLLGMIERVASQKTGPDSSAMDWSSLMVTVEHIFPKARAEELASGEGGAALVSSIGNLTLLEKRLNKNLGQTAAPDKADTYRQSSLALTVHLDVAPGWGTGEIGERARVLAKLACEAWPST